MNQAIKVQYCFEEKAKILKRDSKKLTEYAKYFEENVLPEIREIEKNSRVPHFHHRSKFFPCCDQCA